MIFPPANYQIPPEAHRLYPTGVRFLPRGVGLERMTPDAYDRVVDKIVPAAESLAKEGAQAISIMGTSLTFYKGAAFNQQLIDQVKKATGLPTTSMSTAIVQAARAVGARRIAVATAYADVVNERLRLFLEESGFTVLGVKGLGIERFEDAPPVTQEGLQKFSASVYDSMPTADALVISCGALKTLDLLVPLETHCKVPVISSTPHAFWDAVRMVGLSGQSKGFGRLLDRA
jgi:arylmalonate decarboxylase